MPHLLNRHFLKELDFTREEWTHLLDRGARFAAQARRAREAAADLVDVDRLTHRNNNTH